MASRIELNPRATLDLEDAVDWYDEQSPGLGADLYDEVMRILNLASENPYMFPEIEQGTRRAVTSRFPYLIFYRAESGRISVIGIFHARRSPRGWQDRL